MALIDKMDILKNYAAVGIRNLFKTKLYSLINIFGLAIGLTATILIALFVRYEFSYDQQFGNVDNIHRIEAWSAFAGPGEPKAISIAAPALPFLIENFDEIDTGARLYFGSSIVKSGENVFEETVTYADPAFGEIFTFPALQGNVKDTLADPTQIILTESKAHKYFGSSSAIGQTITLDSEKLFTVGAVINDLPENTHFNFEMLSSFSPATNARHREFEEHWNWGLVHTYLKFKDGVNIIAFQNALPDQMDRLIPNPGGPGSDAKISDFVKYSFVSVPDIHLHSENGAGSVKATSDYGTLISFGIISILILAIASINYINLSTTRSMQRAKEVGIRKVMGANRSQLVMQFLGESLIITTLALFISLAMVELILPAYSTFLELPLSMDFSDSAVLSGIIILALVVGGIGGLYPAFILSSHRPASVIRSNKSSETSGTSQIRSGLIVLQFAISTALIIATVVIYGQTMFAKNIDLGYNKENVIIVRDIANKNVPVDTLVREIENLPNVLSTTRGMTMPADHAGARWRIARKEASAEEAVFATHQSVDYDFFSTFGIDLLAGRFFSQDFETQNFILGQDDIEYGGTIIINEMAARALGFANYADAIGVRISLEPGKSNPEAEIVGVIRDIHHNSAREGIMPWMFYYRPATDSNLAIRYKETDTAALLSQLNNIWSGVAPEVPFKAEFLEENIENQYRSENSRALMFAGFSGLAVLVASLGLFGLASFSAERRTKEIGIRKVLGASVLDIVRLLIWQFSVPVLISNIIAWPIAWYYMSDWLSGFSFRIELDTLPFLIASLLALLIAAFTVGGQALRVARTNPINALRHD